MEKNNNNSQMESLLCQMDDIFAAQQAEELDALTTALLAVAENCDGAQKLDGEGFNRDDYRRGHELADIATWGTLSAIEEKEAKGLLRKYKRQIPEEVYQKLYGSR